MFGKKKKKQADSTAKVSKELGLTFTKGIAYGLGMITAFAIVVPFLAWFLRTFDWVPFISDIAIEVAERMQDANR